MQGKKTRKERERERKKKKKRCDLTVLKWQPVNNHNIPENTEKSYYRSFLPKLSKLTTYKHDILLRENGRA